MIFQMNLQFTDRYWQNRCDDHISRFSPASSVNGEMKKKWIIRDHTRYLLKINTNNYGQQAVNEKIATRLHERLEWRN